MSQLSPGAPYARRPGVLSYAIGRMRTYSLRIRPQYLQPVLDSQRTVEFRVAHPHLSFDAQLEGEDLAGIAPSARRWRLDSQAASISGV